MRLLDLFSGIGGFSLAASWIWDDLEIVGFCEIDKFCQKVLNKNFPGVPIYDDIKKLKGSQFRSVDIITGGFPCQPFSVAGKQRGKKDDRYLWPEMVRIISEVKPNWIIGENVAGIINMGIENMLSDLGNIGYQVELFVIPACAVDAQHRRDRIWVLGYPSSRGWRTSENGKVCRNGLSNSPINSSVNEKTVADTTGKGLPAFGQQAGLRKEKRKTRSSIKRAGLLGQEWDSSWWSTEPELGRMAHGIPNRVDRLKGLGNAIVPQVAMVIMQAIKEIDSKN